MKGDDIISRKFIVYIHRNKFNQKVYVGITSQSLRDRWQNGRGYHKQPKFYNAILKYGWDNFEHIIVAEGLTRYQACKMEQRLIEGLESRNKVKGYNIALGGEGTDSVSDETKTKMSQAQRKRYEDPEERKKLSNLQRERYQSTEALEKQREIIKRCITPDVVARRAATMRKKYEDPEERKKTSIATKRYFEEHPEASEVLRARNKKRYEDEAEREKTSAANRKRFSDENERRKVSEALKNYYSTQEGKARKSEAMKQRWSDPEERKRQSERLRKSWEKRKQDTKNEKATE